jgi:hypothetical protein
VWQAVPKPIVCGVSGMARITSEATDGQLAVQLVTTTERLQSGMAERSLVYLQQRRLGDMITDSGQSVFR